MELDLTKRITFCSLINDLNADDIRSITTLIRSLILSSFPSSLEVTQASIQSRKEFKDREIVVDALII